MPTPRPIVAELFALTREHFGQITDMHLETITGIADERFGRWRKAEATPTFANAMTWAAHVGMTLAVVDRDGAVLSVGDAIPGSLRTLREAAGKKQSALAAVLFIDAASISYRERSTRPFLSMIEDYLSALDLRLVLVVDPDRKRCKSCRLSKPFEAFSATGHSGARRNVCKPCFAASRRPSTQPAREAAA